MRPHLRHAATLHARVLLLATVPAPPFPLRPHPPLGVDSSTPLRLFITAIHCLISRAWIAPAPVGAHLAGPRLQRVLPRPGLPAGGPAAGVCVGGDWGESSAAVVPGRQMPRCDTSRSRAVLAWIGVRSWDAARPRRGQASVGSLRKFGAGLDVLYSARGMSDLALYRECVGAHSCVEPRIIPRY